MLNLAGRRDDVLGLIGVARAMAGHDRLAEATELIYDLVARFGGTSPRTQDDHASGWSRRRLLVALATPGQYEAAVLRDEQLPGHWSGSTEEDIVKGLLPLGTGRKRARSLWE